MAGGDGKSILEYFVKTYTQGALSINMYLSKDSTLETYVTTWSTIVWTLKNKLGNVHFSFWCDVVIQGRLN